MSSVIKLEDLQHRLGVLIDHGDRLLIVRPAANFPRTTVEVALWYAKGERIDMALDADELAAVLGVIAPHATKPGERWEHSADAVNWTECPADPVSGCLAFPHHRRADG